MPAAFISRDLAPTHALRAIAVLAAAGHEAWVVGGWVRDALRGCPAHDVDVCTDATWQQSEAAFAAAGVEVHETGIKHGTVTAIVCGQPVEVTTYRIDGDYSDSRHPDSVTFVRDVREDLARRDFTVNAMAWHPDRGLLDPFGGCEDLAAGLIRAVGDPARRFEEDALRILRAVRFACRLGFIIEPGTQAALEAAAPTLDRVAQERIGSELRGIVATGRASWAIREQREVMFAALPELAPMDGFDQRSPYHVYDVLEHTLRVMEGVESLTSEGASERLRWAAMLHDMGKPTCFTIDDRGQGHFFGHPAEGMRMARALLHRLAIPHELAQPIVALVRYHDRPTQPNVSSMLSLIASVDAMSGLRERSEVIWLMRELLCLRRADALAKAPECRGYAYELNEHERVLGQIEREGLCWRVRDLAVSGGDLIRECGMSPGPAVGEALSRALGAVMAVYLKLCIHSVHERYVGLYFKSVYRRGHTTPYRLQYVYLVYFVLRNFRDIISYRLALYNLRKCGSFLFGKLFAVVNAVYNIVLRHNDRRANHRTCQRSSPDFVYSRDVLAAVFKVFSFVF